MALLISLTFNFICLEAIYDHTVMAKLTKFTTLGLLASAAIGLTACQSTLPRQSFSVQIQLMKPLAQVKTKIQVHKKNALASTKPVRVKPLSLKTKCDIIGAFNEKTGRMIDQMGSIAGAVLGTGSPNLSRDDDFEYDISFRCQ